MRIGKIFNYLLISVVIISVSLFIKDVHNVTQDRIATLKRDLVLAVEQRDAVRLDIETLQVANSDLLKVRKTLEESDSKKGQELNSLMKLKEEQQGTILSLQHDLAVSKADLDKARMEIESARAEKVAFSGKEAQIKLELDHSQVLVKKMVQDKDDEIANLKRVLESTQNELKSLHASAGSKSNEMSEQEKLAQTQISEARVQKAVARPGADMPESTEHGKPTGSIGST
jgi:chromosome segregation ATPase